MCVNHYGQPSLRYSAEAGRPDFLPFAAVYVGDVEAPQEAVLRSTLIPLISMTVSHLSGKSCAQSK